MSASLSWMAWCSAMGLPKVLPLLGVVQGGVEGGPGDAHRPGGDVDATDLQHPEDLGEPPAGFADQVGGRDAVVGVGHLHRLDAPVAELADVSCSPRCPRTWAPAPSPR